jgi:hypothetical protein
MADTFVVLEDGDNQSASETGFHEFPGPDRVVFSEIDRIHILVFFVNFVEPPEFLDFAVRKLCLSEFGFQMPVVDSECFPIYRSDDTAIAWNKAAYLPDNGYEEIVGLQGGAHGLRDGIGDLQPGRPFVRLPVKGGVPDGRGQVAGDRDEKLFLGIGKGRHGFPAEEHMRNVLIFPEDRDR